MENSTDPKDLNKNEGDKKIVNQSDKIVNGETEHLHEATNEEHWVNDVNEEFGEDNILPEEEDKDDLN